MSMVTSSGTRSPRSMKLFASRPSSVPCPTLARKMSPVEILGTCRCSAMNWACVPLPAPGGPTRTRRTSESPGASSEEALVVAQHELALDLLHGLQPDADDDEHSCAAEGEPVGACREVEQ